MHQGFTDIPQDIKPVGPNLMTQAINLAKSIPAIVESGCKLVPDDVYEVRLGICATCYFWDENDNAGFGKCNHPKCGCSKAKQRIAISSCPIGNWGAYAH